MKIGADRLAGQLKGELAPVYLISGDDQLLVDEAADAIRARARALEFNERERHVVEAGFDWDRVGAGGANMSLFSSRKLIEIQMPTAKPGVKGARALAEMAAQAGGDTCLLVMTSRLDGASRNAAWVKALDAAGVLVQIWPMDAANLPRWIEERMRARGLQPIGDAVALLADRVQGNLLAADQEIEKLLLLHGRGDVDGPAVARAVADSARFDVFALADAALVGDTARAVRILDGLRAEGVAMPLILWALVRDLQELTYVKFAAATGRGSVERIIDGRRGIWSNRKALFRRAVDRLPSVTRCYALLDRAAYCEAVVKGQKHGDDWAELLGLVCDISGARLPLAQAI